MSRTSKCYSSNKQDLIECMTCRNYKPLEVYRISDSYIVAVYQGKLSEYDIILRYRQKDSNGKWSQIRTPKHIHWAVDMLIKLTHKEDLAKRFLDFLLRLWEDTKGFKTKEEREEFLREESLLKSVEQEAKNFEELSKHGEYSIKFLILLAKLLMKQEKTNREDAYMFRKLLETLKEHREIYKIVSIATHK
ncbi:MAG: hypothetical protein DSZ31_03130 [Gammaproteobacteria bacterium]|nr:MAG: hypothetical protein DSZ31_03130 [Gammaproteobacteria bacterium]